MSDQASGSRRDDRDRDGRDSRDRDGGRGRGASSSGSGGPGGTAGGRRFYRRKKVDYFSVNKIDHISYRDADMLRQFLGDGGKILPRRHTGLSAQNQRLLKRAIKRARNIALLPFGGSEN
jgi:small subunit ribosomal protein S18